MSLSTTSDNCNKNKNFPEENNLTESLLNSLKMQDQFDILDLSELDLDNSETWLYEVNTPTKSSKIIKQQISSYSGDQIELLNDIKLKSIKSIDTRTFTRPKKKLMINRLSINDIEQMYQNGNDGIMNSSCEGIQSLRTKVPQSVIQEEFLEPNKFQQQQPVQFDLTQPISLHNFDSFTMMSYSNATIDRSYLQDMSPPSLVNSLCSSTFANLMESSLIKNDPILSEIRDKDYTESVLLEDIEAPLFQSITESFSSINSDTPENFLKKVTRDNTTAPFRRNTTVIDNSTLKKISDNFDTIKKMSNNETVIVNSTYEVANYSSGDSQTDKQNSSTDDGSLNITQKPIISNISNDSIENFNGTYRRTPKQQNGTFIKSEDKNPNDAIINTTYGRKNSIPNDLTYNSNNNNKGSSEESLSCTRTNSTTGKTAILRGNSLENLKKRFSSDGSINSDPLSYSQHDEEEERKDKFNSTCPGALVVDDLAAEIKSFRSSLGSADSLDRMSSLSSSSKGSNKVLSMEDVQAIVEMQERSLNRAISTPKVRLENRQFWENSYISPIVNDTKNHSSDSEILEERKSTKPHQLIKRDTFIRKLPTTKQLGPLANKELKFKSNNKKIISDTIVRPKPLKAFPADVRGSYTNIAALKDATFNFGGSQQNLSKPSPPTTINHGSSANSTNLNSMGMKLKGSYTSLKPLSANLLPVVPSAVVAGNNSTKTRPNSSAIGKSESPPVAKVPTGETATTNRASGLPRPTGIPRPFSRIPGPRSGIAKSSSARGVNNY